MKDIQVILLCGGISKCLYPFVNKNDIKHLLPIANKPLINYSFELFHKHFISDIIVICNTENKNKLEKHYNSEISKNLDFRNKKVFFFANKECTSLMDYLVLLKNNNRLNKDFMLYSGDLICDVNLNNLIDFHYKNDSNFTILFTKKNVIKENKIDKNNILITMDENNEIYNLTNLKKSNEKGINFKPIIHQKINKLICKNNLNFAHIFVSSLEIVNIMEKKLINHTSLLEDFIPYLIYGKYNENNKKLIKNNLNNENAMEKYLNNQLFKNNENLIIKAMISSENYIRRVDNLNDYLSINIESIGLNNKNPYNNVKENCIITKEYIAEKTAEIVEDGPIKRCVIGENCKIETNCKVENCVIMKNTIIKSGCNLKNSVIGYKNIINNDVNLKDTYVGNKFIFKDEIKSYEEKILNNVEEEDNIKFEDEKLERKYSNI